MLEHCEFTIYVHHGWSIEGKLLLGRVLMLGSTWVLSQLGSSSLVTEGGPLVPRLALCETVGSVNPGGG